MKQTKNIVLIAAAVIIIILLLKYCKGGDVEIKETVRIDTVEKEAKRDTVFQPKIVKQYLLGKVPPALEKWDTLYVVEPTDTAAILREYYSFNLYSDTIPIIYKDKNDTLVWSWMGEAIISDTVSRNRILGRKFSYDIHWQEITKTITRTVYDKRAQLYAEFGLLGNTSNLASGAEIGLLLKTKNDRMVGLGYETIFDGENYFKIKYAHKISFKKK